MNISQLMELGEIIDKACDNNDNSILNNKIKYMQSYVETLDDSEKKVYLYYFLANAWSGLRHISHKEDESTIWKLEQKELFKEIYYFRKAIKEKDFDKVDINLRLSIYTNLGNVFSHYGRTILALKYYDKALELDADFFMALSNRARCLEAYTQLDYDQSHQNLLLRFSYFDYKEASIEYSIKDYANIEYYKTIQKQNSLNIEKIENFLSIKWLNENIDLDNCLLGENDNEINYREWVLENKLFLNTMNDLGNFNIAAHDPLTLPNLTIEISIGFPKYITYFNQIKQEYISYRHLLFEGLNELSNKFYDNNTVIIDDCDYNLHSVDIEKIKLSFRGFYSLFDKIANFMNEYFKLELPERQVDFRRVWYKSKGKEQKLNSLFDKSENLALRGLYLVSKDLYFNNKDEDSINFIDVLEPDAKEINKIRNHLEHKFITIKMFDINEIKEEFDREKIFSISREGLESKTIYLAQLAREAIINLSFSVNIEEKKKDIDKKCANMPLNIVNEY